VVVVLVDEGTGPWLKIARQEVILQQHPVLHGLVPVLDLALGLGSLPGAALPESAAPAFISTIWA
jgi:hypothetical protein